MRTVVVIPARYSSTRFPGKPLALLLGKPMILWVAELSAKAVGAENVYIATESKQILNVVLAAGYNSIMTDPHALTGTDRVAEAAQKIDAEIYINVQGDEPLVDPQDILRVANEKTKNMDLVINGYTYLQGDEDPHNINIPKVVTNELDDLLYMSRSTIPGCKDLHGNPISYKKQVCIYAFNRVELDLFLNYGRKSYLENYEDIEILRFFEMGRRIKMIKTKPGSLAVDRVEDIPAVERCLKIAN